MDSTGLYEAFREDVVDTAKPYLWTEDEVWRYMDYAYRLFVRLTGGVHDFLSDVTRINVVAGEATAEMHESIIKTEQAFKMSDGKEIEIVNWSDQKKMATADYGIVRQIYLDDRPGPVQYMVIGNQRGVVKWVRVPEYDDTVQLQVYRLPIDHIIGDDQEFVDVAEDHHNQFLLGMKSQAYLKQDAETFNRAKADENDQKFRAYCAFVKSEWERYKHKPRVVTYGGI